MKSKYGFLLMDLAEFGNWLDLQQVSRVIHTIQNHHTYLPDYTHFTGSNHFARLQSMKHYHMMNNGWSNIAQTFTTFPDGKIGVCRPLNDVPVGIKGQNSKGICIEHFGNFDIGRDQMTPAHQNTIVMMNALLCRKFKLQVNTDHIVYHHWFNLNSGLRTNGKGITKSCPGTAFFGGNKVEDANVGFIPLIKSALAQLSGNNDTTTVTPGVASEPKPATKSGIVSASSLNVRKGPGGKFPVVTSLSAGSEVGIFENLNGWHRIGIDEWVSGRYVIITRKAKVTAGSLNIRTGPGVQFSKLGAIRRDTQVLVFDTLNGWCRIDINDKWVAEQYLDFIQ